MNWTVDIPIDQLPALPPLPPELRPGWTLHWRNRPPSSPPGRPTKPRRCARSWKACRR
ncbi:phospho-2-dehydro-3-deoxyheptonate aldolase domain protein [Mycobacterium xenopi 4042]|uniref:Phospho-2-dehydro-3-deoxyheptonate aldolase domain protein n=1 Tax=Mycobacterium xenopi 4042 TaxID=1299334 RepID=X7ZWG7_MYCXE|nr:phospho-2-dehydro-3-deoxyheptonate aldolase domain protein [Mycobacterium xenopi 4042]